MSTDDPGMSIYSRSTTDRMAPVLSVVVPVHQTGPSLERTLRALQNSDLPRDTWELVVVDDGSTDDSPLIAAQYADLVVRLPGPAYGPAYARNRGVELSRGSLIAFVDHDVCVHPDALRRLVDRLNSDPSIAAVCGTYDTEPTAPGFVSQYRNLLRHFGQKLLEGDATSFWAGCAAIRRSVLTSVGMFNEWHFTRPQIEADELGVRIRKLDMRIVVDSAICGTHLKRWTLGSFVLSDIHDRRIAEARVLGGGGARNSGPSRWTRLAAIAGAVLVWFAVFALIAGALGAPRGWPIAAVIALFLTFELDRPLYSFFVRVRGFGFAVATIPLRLLTHAVSGVAWMFGSFLRHTVGEPRPDPTTEAFAEVGLKTWPPIPTKRHVGEAPTSTR